MKCTACGNENPKDGQFCGGCGTSLSVSTASSTGVESAEVPMTEDRRQLGPDEHFCSSCGEIIKKLAEICPKCGVRLSDASDREKTSPQSSWLLAIPITSLVLGIIGSQMFFVDSAWDFETARGGLLLFGIPAIVLGVISIAKNLQGKLMGIIGLILGCINSVGLIVIMATM